MKINAALGGIRVATTELSVGFRAAQTSFADVYASTTMRTATTKVAVGLNLSANDSVPAAAWTGGANPAVNTYNSVTTTSIFDSLGNAHVMSTYFIKTAHSNAWIMAVQIDNTDVGSATTLHYQTNGLFLSTTPDPITLAYHPANANAMSITLDLAESTQFASPFAVQSMVQDGFTTGRLDSVDVSHTT